MGRVNLKFRLPVSPMLYVLMVIFFAGTVVLVALAVAIWTGTVRSDPPMSVDALLVIGIMLPAASFVSFLFMVKCIFFNYNELTDKTLIVSISPFRVKVPLEEIVEIVSDREEVLASLGKSMDVKYRETGEDEFEGGRFKFYGVTVTNYGGKKIVKSVYSSKNLVLIKAKRHEITTNVPDTKEFVDLISKAIQKRKSELGKRGEAG